MRSLLFLAALTAQAAEPPPGLYFDGPEVVKLDWNTACPRVGDFNGDGLQDLVLLNQDRARIEFLLQRKDGPKAGEPERTSRSDRWNPILEMSRLDKQPLVIGKSAWSLAVGDWNGDSRPDIAYTDSDDKLVLRTQGAKAGDWTQKKEFTLDSVAEDPDVLVATDLNADGRQDIALLTNTRLMIWLQKEPGTWAEAKSYVLGQSGCGGLRQGDLNGDGRLDLFYTAPDADALLVRLQQPDTGYGEEWRLELPSSRCWVHPVKLDGKAALAWIRDDTGMIEVSRLSFAPTAPDAELAATIRHAMPSADGKGSATAYGDLNGDEVADIVLAEPRNARLWFFAGQKQGGFAEGREFPALSGIEGLAIADVDGDKQTELLLLSPAEKSIGLSRWQKSRLTYPEVIYQATTEPLLALQAGKVGDSADNAVLALSEAKGKTQLLTLRWNAAEKKFIPSSQDLPSAPTRTNALRVLDANQDGRGDLALFSGIASMQILLSQNDSKAPFKRAEGLPDNLLNKLPPSALTTTDLDGDGKAEIIVAKDQLARAFRIGKDGKAVTVEQFNAPDATAQISSVIAIPGKDKPRILLADPANGRLFEMAPGTDAVYRSTQTYPLSSLTPEECHLLTGNEGSSLLLIGKTSFEISPLTAKALKLDTVTSFDSELKDTTASDLIAAPFSAGKNDDFLLIDSGKSHVLEFFESRPSTSGPPEWVSALHFRVFETDPQYRGKTGLANEPHDYIAADLNGDGKLDLVLLAHDRLLLYMRK